MYMIMKARNCSVPCERRQVDACVAVLSAVPKRCRMGFRSERSPLVEALPRWAPGAERGDGVFPPIKTRIVGCLPNSHALAAHSFAPQQAAHPFVGHPGQQLP